MATAVHTNTLINRYQTPQTALNRVMSEAPFFPRVSDNKTATLSRPIGFAIRWPYMQVNRRDFVSWMVFDCDHSDVYQWERVGLPAPNLIVSNGRGKGVTGFHLFYAIEGVCTSQKARSHPIRYLKACYSEMARLLGADPDYHGGPICKTPGHPWWLTVELHAHEYSLGELNEYFDIPAEKPKFSKGPNVFDLTHSRALTLFEQLRFFAYATVNIEREKGNFESFTKRIEAYASQINDFECRGFRCFKTGVPKGDLPPSDLRYTIKSVARWTWDKYTGDARCNRGVMQLPKSLPIQQKQALAARRTHSERTRQTGDKVRTACAVLRANGERITQAAVARYAQITRQTVSTYKSVIEEVLQEIKQPGKDVSTPDLVKFGVHQVTTPWESRHDSGVRVRGEGASRPMMELVIGGKPPFDSS